MKKKLLTCENCDCCTKVKRCGKEKFQKLNEKLFDLECHNLFLVRFIKEHPNDWEEILKRKPYSLFIKS